MIANKVNVLFGGGKKYFLPKSDPKSGRKDNRDLIAEARQAGYTYVTTESELQSLRESTHVLGLFQFDSLKTAAPEPNLASLTRKAIEVLRKAKANPPMAKAGFFLMVEGSQIDWACHDNEAASVRSGRRCSSIRRCRPLWISP